MVGTGVGGMAVGVGGTVDGTGAVAVATGTSLATPTGFAGMAVGAATWAGLNVPAQYVANTLTPARTSAAVASQNAPRLTGWRVSCPVAAGAVRRSRLRSGLVARVVDGAPSIGTGAPGGGVAPAGAELV